MNTTVPDKTKSKNTEPDGTGADWRLYRRLWTWFSAREVLLGFLVVFGLALWVSHLIPQIPSAARLNLAGYQEWLSETRRQYKGWTTFLEAVGLFHVRDSAWFYGLLALLCFSLLVSAGSAFEQARALARPCSPGEHVGPLNLLTLVFSGGVQEAVDEVRRAFASAFRSVRLRELDAGVWGVCGQRAAWLAYARPVVYAGMLLAVGSVAIDGRWGWTQESAHLVPSRQEAVGPRQALVIELHTDQEGVRLSLPNGASAALDQNRPVRLAGHRYTLAQAHSPLVRLTAYSVDGQDLTLYEYAVRPQPGKAIEFEFSTLESEGERDHLFIVSEEKLVGRIEWLSPQSANETTEQVFRLGIFGEDGQVLVGDQEIRVGEEPVSSVIGDVIYRLDVSRYAVVDIAYEPGAWPLRIGIALLVIGILASLLPMQHTWATVRGRDDQTLIEVHDLREGIFLGHSRRKQRLLDQLAAIGETREQTG